MAASPALPGPVPLSPSRAMTTLLPVWGLSRVARVVASVLRRLPVATASFLLLHPLCVVAVPAIATLVPRPLRWPLPMLATTAAVQALGRVLALPRASTAVQAVGRVLSLPRSSTSSRVERVGRLLA